MPYKQEDETELLAKENLRLLDRLSKRGEIKNNEKGNDRNENTWIFKCSRWGLF